MTPGQYMLWAVIYFSCLCSASLANNPRVNFREKEKKILDQILGQGKYDARIRPSGINGTDGPAVVRINLFVRSIATISDIKMVSARSSPSASANEEKII
ncbi:hypothetical protein PVAND_009206 [Polypedilum vanderplanki]|uniref:Uncharacterized protein n=1 Tax=Polypedilum vanderplanki TaxID=319348 RepID=A0A9J6CD23_POLVA|nr:hypothetical protein PVAND_009206 [Polypedilum vanderplanki]